MSEAINTTREEYLGHIEKQKTSGLSIKKYCILNGLIDHKFSYYRTYNLKTNSQSTSENSFAAVKLKNWEQIEQKPTVKSNSPNVDPIWLAQFLQNLWTTLHGVQNISNLSVLASSMELFLTDSGAYYIINFVV